MTVDSVQQIRQSNPNEPSGSLYVLQQQTGEQSLEKKLVELLKATPEMIAQEQLQNGQRLDVRV
jgi:hypothetical protein